MDATGDFSDRSVGAHEHLAQAYAHEQVQEFEMALRECERALQLDPSLAEAHNLRGILLEELGRKRSAISAYRRALELDPSFEEAKQNLEKLAQSGYADMKVTKTGVIVYVFPDFASSRIREEFEDL